MCLLLQVFLWDVASGGVIRKFKGHDSRINAVSTQQAVTHCMSIPADLQSGLRPGALAPMICCHALRRLAARATLHHCDLDSAAV